MLQVSHEKLSPIAILAFEEIARTVCVTGLQPVRPVLAINCNQHLSGMFAVKVAMVLTY